LRAGKREKMGSAATWSDHIESIPKVKNRAQKPSVSIRVPEGEIQGIIAPQAQGDSDE